MRSFLFALLLFAQTASNADVVLPDLPHARWDVIPFGDRSGDGRFQQVYHSSMFDDEVEITSISFSVLRAFTFTADIVIRLGVTLASPHSLSTDLDSNVTDGLATVFSDNSFTQFTPSGEETFGLVFELQNKFEYEPTSGLNLLLDIQISGKTDLVNEQGVSMIASEPTTIVGRAYEMTGFAGTNPWGARTLFGTSDGVEVDEPAAFALLGLGLAGLRLARRRVTPRR